MDIRKIKKLIELLQESGLAEIEIKEGEESVRINRGSPAATTVVHTVPALTSAPAAPSQTGAEPAISERYTVNAPMVGTFFASPTPGTPAFVAIGQQIKKGDILCIIEAMKIMNQIEADRDGVITAVLVENGQPVEFGQPLFAVQ
ncbi:MAG TPA: acetyl-CoA carboxylase biotin carboxyl carrier protein [Gammaproteobacteria bacterium]|nr:acetyl-CoA carboxylase biotin carboxyl carrier protein [Gammaproteobacteria bacterium]